MYIFVHLILCGLAAYRLTVLLVNDEGPWRLIGRFRDLVGMKTRVLECAHCTGVWMALLTFWLPYPVLFVLAVAGMQSFMEACLERKFSL